MRDRASSELTPNYQIDLTEAKSFRDFVNACNRTFIEKVGGNWSGGSWDAFHDYLSWPEHDTYSLTILGWESTVCLSAEDRNVLLDIFANNPHVRVVMK